MKKSSLKQSGFRSLHSTVTALLEATDSWALIIDHGYVNAVVFVDLRKGILHCWSWDIVVIIAQLTVVSLTSSLLYAVYLIYINDLSNCLSFSIPRMYADDTHITYAGSDLHLIQSSLSHGVEKLSNWLVSDRLALKTIKTEFMLIGSRQRSSTLSDTLELSIDNIPINQVSSVKSLGIYVEENST